MDLAARLPCSHLHIARALQRPEAQIGLRNVVSPREQAMVAQDHDVLFAEIAHEAVALRQIYRNALELVIRDAAMQHRAIEVMARQAVLERSHRDAIRRM